MADILWSVSQHLKLCFHTGHERKPQLNVHLTSFCPRQFHLNVSVIFWDHVVLFLQLISCTCFIYMCHSLFYCFISHALESPRGSRSESLTSLHSQHLFDLLKLPDQLRSCHSETHHLGRQLFFCCCCFFNEWNINKLRLPVYILKCRLCESLLKQWTLNWKADIHHGPGGEHPVFASGHLIIQ